MTTITTTAKHRSSSSRRRVKSFIIAYCLEQLEKNKKSERIELREGTTTAGLLAPVISHNCCLSSGRSSGVSNTALPGWSPGVTRSTRIPHTVKRATGSSRSKTLLDNLPETLANTLLDILPDNQPGIPSKRRRGATLIPLANKALKEPFTFSKSITLQFPSLRQGKPS